VQINNLQFVAMLEPFVRKDKIEGYRRFLGFNRCLSNDIGHIWCFWTGNFIENIVRADYQQVTINLKDANGGSKIYITAVYAKCTPEERMELWDSLIQLESLITGPWCIGGISMSILDPCERGGGGVGVGRIEYARALILLLVWIVLELLMQGMWVLHSPGVIIGVRGGGYG
ncbi:hypothetical protein A4A49_61829, partial [Nicotiana attenuata]